MKKALMILVAMAATCAGAQNIVVEKSSEKTAKDMPFGYEAEKTTMEGNYVRLIGTVKNTGKECYLYVRVTFTANKGYSTFMTRDVAYAEPSEIGPGQVGYIDARINVDGIKPDRIEWSVMGNAIR